jgi:plasmid stabilization system protein ParE
LKVRFVARALPEAVSARYGYADRDPESVELFDRSLDDAVELLEGYPEAGRMHLWGTRRLVLKSVPYYLVYRIGLDEIVIVAVAHFKQRPGYWRGRR